jgi:hypothetical protein
VVDDPVREQVVGVGAPGMQHTYGHSVLGQARSARLIRPNPTASVEHAEPRVTTHVDRGSVEDPARTRWAYFSPRGETRREFIIHGSHAAPLPRAAADPARHVGLASRA